MPKRVKHEVDLRSATITIAIAQIKGPLPDGKHRSLVGEDVICWLGNRSKMSWPESKKQVAL